MIKPSPYNDNGVIRSEAQPVFDRLTAQMRDLAQTLTEAMTFRDLYAFMTDAAHTAVADLVCARQVSAAPETANRCCEQFEAVAANGLIKRSHGNVFGISQNRPGAFLHALIDRCPWCGTRLDTVYKPEPR